jgi:DNA gyrase subunit A
MDEIAKHLVPINLDEEMRRSYMSYAMSVIVGRALPDVRDGLKPVHRRVLFSMHELGNDWNKAYKKSARVVGDVIGKYHPHGESAVYDTIVRMAQNFSLRYMLVDGQGNFGSVDGDPPAAMRYTEVRMSRMAHELLADLDRDTVDFVPNYDGAEREPVVMPTRVPNLLVNGSSGIAVGMATNIPPHNLGEICDACLALLANPGLDIDDLMRLVPGPDFPTAGIINGAHGIREAYRTGRGRIHVRGRAFVETYGEQDAERIVVVELPYQVNKARLMEKIAELVKDRKLEGIRDLRDESDREGMRMVIELRRGESGEVMINNLYQQTQLQVVFGINCVALVDGQPRTLNLKEFLECFLRHRRTVVTRRTLFDLGKARRRAHELEGLAVALSNLDPIIELIKSSPSPAAAKEGLLARPWPPGLVLDLLSRTDADRSRPADLAPHYGLLPAGYSLSPVQAEAILELRLQRLTGLEREKIVDEYRKHLETIGDLLDILARPERLVEVIRDELTEIRRAYADPRRTEIRATHEALGMEDLIDPEDLVVTVSHAGYVKSQPMDDYRAQRRGGKGKAATSMKEEDFIDRVFVANTHDTMLCFSSRGRLYWIKVYELPQAGRGARGRPIVNLLPLAEGERITAFLPIKEFTADRYIFMATRRAIVKKTPLSEFSRPRASGIIAVDLTEDDSLVGVALTDGQQNVMLVHSGGKAVCFPETDVRPMGRGARGVHGMRLPEGTQIISLIVADPDRAILVATENGFGKRTEVEEFRVQGRHGQGVICIQTTTRNGQVVAAVPVREDDEVMLITDRGTLVRIPVRQISLVGRNTQGVTLIALGKDEKLVGMERIAEGAAEAEVLPILDGEGASEGEGATAADLATSLTTGSGQSQEDGEDQQGGSSDHDHGGDDDQ